MDLPAPPPKSEIITKDARGRSVFDRWLYIFWSYVGSLRSVPTGGDPGQIVGVDEDGDLSFLDLEGGDGLSVTLDGTTLTIALDEETMTQLQTMQNLLERILLEARRQSLILQQSTRVTVSDKEIR